MGEMAFVRSAGGRGVVGSSAPAVNERRGGRSVATPKMTLEYVGHEDQVRKAGADMMQDFVTRRAVNTLLFYLREFHDGASEKWLRKFEGFSHNEKDFDDWEGYITRMFQAESVQGTEVWAHPKGNWRREFKFTIEPSRLAMRLLATRKHLAEEWQRDLNVLDMENLEVTRMHFELSMDPAADLGPLRQRILDVDVMDDDSSPLRVQNYKLIRGLATHYAAHRLLQRMKEKSNHHFMWLSEYLSSNPVCPDSEGFLHRMLRANAELRKNPDTYISPAKIARMIMNIRLAVAEEWIKDLTSVEEDNLQVQRAVLEMRAARMIEEK